MAEFEGGSVLADELVWNDSWMADHQVAEGWWIADDGRWFAPHLHPDVMAAAATPAVEAEEAPLVAARTDAALAAEADPVAEALPTQEPPPVEPAPEPDVAASAEPTVAPAVPEADSSTTWVVQPPLPYGAKPATQQPAPAPGKVETGSVLESIRKAPTPLPTSATPAPEVAADSTDAADAGGFLAPRRTTTKAQPKQVAASTPEKSGRWKRKIGALVALVALGALVWFVGSELIDRPSTADGVESASSATSPESAAADPVTIEASSSTTPSVAPATSTTIVSTTATPTTTAAEDDAPAASDGDGNPASTQQKLGSLELKRLRDELYDQDLFAVVAMSDAELSTTAASVCQMATNADLDEDYHAGVGRLAGDLDVDIMVAMAIGRVVLEQNCPDQIERLRL